MGIKHPHNFFGNNIVKIFLIVVGLLLLATASNASDKDLKEFIWINKGSFHKSSSKTITPVIDRLLELKSNATEGFLLRWINKELWFRKSDGLIVIAKELEQKTYEIFDVIDGQLIEVIDKKKLKQIKPNSGVRAIISSALVQFQLLNTDSAIRLKTLDSIARKPEEKFRIPLRKAIEIENDLTIKNKMIRLEKLLTVRFEKNITKRVEVIRSLKNDLGIDVRGVLNQITRTELKAEKSIPENINVSHILDPDTGAIDRYNFLEIKHPTTIPGLFTDLDAYLILIKKQKAPEILTQKKIKNILIQQAEDGNIKREEAQSLDSYKKRKKVLNRLINSGKVDPVISREEMKNFVKQHVFYEEYFEKSKEVTDAATETLNIINGRVSVFSIIDLILEGLSLASIYFLAAIGLAITFGVMRVINMAHGEFIMMGAYSGYVVQLFIANYTLSILIAIPVAFFVTFIAGVVMERLVIKKLYKRPLETLLATFGISIALQQLAKIIFGTQARPLTSPTWLDGALIVNEIISISWIRVAIFVLSIIFTIMLIYILNKTRFGLETRAVTQNPSMAASMGVNPDRINMFTFGLGSGIAGIAGVGIGLYAKVTSELGNDYIVQSFMTVVVGGVGSIWGTLAGATLIGFLQKAIEWFNPSNTLAAQTYMIIFIIIFIQFRPRGIVALKGRAAGD